MIKTGDEKSSDTVPLISECTRENPSKRLKKYSSRELSVAFTRTLTMPRSHKEFRMSFKLENLAKFVITFKNGFRILIRDQLPILMEKTRARRLAIDYHHRSNKVFSILS
jgi:hypothetical protein